LIFDRVALRGQNNGIFNPRLPPLPERVSYPSTPGMGRRGGIGMAPAPYIYTLSACTPVQVASPKPQPQSSPSLHNIEYTHAVYDWDLKDLGLKARGCADGEGKDGRPETRSEGCSAWDAESEAGATGREECLETVGACVYV